MANKEKKYFTKVICDGGETIINLTHVLTHHDLETIQTMRNMLNETLCNEDNIKQAHLSEIDTQMFNLLEVNRLSLDIYMKLVLLKEEDESKMRKVYPKTLKNDNTGVEEENFFLEEELEDARKGIGYEEV